MKKLHPNDLHALSNGFVVINTMLASTPNSELLQAVLAEVKVKTDKKIASGYVPLTGCKITLTQAQYAAMLMVGRICTSFHFTAFDNARLRLLMLNKR